jgi:hypothetical protein
VKELVAGEGQQGTCRKLVHAGDHAAGATSSQATDRTVTGSRFTDSE